MTSSVAPLADCTAREVCAREGEADSSGLEGLRHDNLDAFSTSSSSGLTCSDCTAREIPFDFPLGCARGFGKTGQALAPLVKARGFGMTSGRWPRRTEATFRNERGLLRFVVSPWLVEAGQPRSIAVGCVGW